MPTDPIETEVLPRMLSVYGTLADYAGKGQPIPPGIAADLAELVNLAGTWLRFPDLMAAKADFTPAR